jgi:hypothetical protein
MDGFASGVDLFGCFVFPVDKLVTLLPEFEEFGPDIDYDGCCPRVTRESELLDPIALEVLFLESMPLIGKASVKELPPSEFGLFMYQLVECGWILLLLDCARLEPGLNSVG